MHAQFFGRPLCRKYRRDAAETYARADTLTAFATTQGLVHHAAYGRILLGWELARQGDATTGVAYIHQGLAALPQQTGLKLYRPYFLALLAEASGQAGQPEAGLTILAEALTLVAGDRGALVGGRGVSAPGGAMLLQLPSPNMCQAEGCFASGAGRGPPPAGQGVGAARRALSLSRLWHTRASALQPTSC